MDTFTAMKVYCSVVENDSLAGAARSLNVSPSVVSKQLSALEDRLGVRLINRTTRRISVTQEGTAYYESCKRIITDVAEAENAASSAHAAPRGLLKITAPVTFAHRHLTPHLPKFLDMFPEVEVQVQVNDRVVDLVDEGIDLAIRISQLKDSSLIARRLAPNRRYIAATPEYLKKNGTPNAVDDLKEHRLITWPPGNPLNDWHFLINGIERIMKVNGAIAVNEGDGILTTLLAGGGLGMTQEFLAGPYVREKKLVPLLEEFVREDNPIYAVYPSNKHLSPKVRAFVDFLVKIYSPTPYWINN
ncbi:MAG: LysR family transcriptional regulator [Rhodospirillaceae bacterium]|nr:LysR family transcriptional regulator [Rhodospirillaceae bacterium]MBT5912633.1 LysR family transcriptional regulator [Rhodospirillaceae bacterium]MBT6306639.1 LysR family transcriptional regulator [Rhodospirillaceae bacterium]MBT7730463.1 LysR family transcriptional regulator [Rhodospirillaceae bacterium]